ncbi:MAG TPA: hypothetical protein VFE23_11200 [Usitatibacter sp.]|jgi:ABC-2 type transport system permease protein|nr:hypothetical protein [Usitatibacter sp.]
MRILEPPGWAWLMRHELRLEWRAFGGGRLFIVLVGGGLVYALAHLAAWAVMRASPPESWLAAAAPGLIVAEMVVALLVLSSAFGLAVRALFFRGDLDLMLSAPVPVSTLLAVRAAFVALGCVALVALLWSPFVNVGLFFGRARALLAYPVLAAFGLACASIAFCVTLALARVVGVRRARILAQVLGAVIGAALVIAMQVPNLMSDATRMRYARWLSSGGAHDWMGPASPLAWPLRALFGEPLPALAAIVAGVALFLAMLPLNRRAFLDAVQRSGEGTHRARVAAAGAHERRFRTGLARIVIAKELRLIVRDPMLIASTLLQALYLVPLVLVMVSRGESARALLGPAVLLLASTLCGNLAWICVSAEEAPDLLGSAPVAHWRVDVLKASAAVLVPALLSLPFVAWYLMHSVIDGVAVALFVALSLFSTALIQLWTARPARARDLAVRRKDHVTTNLIEMAGSMGWAAACFGALAHGVAPALGIAVAGGALLAAYLMRPRRGD